MTKKHFIALFLAAVVLVGVAVTVNQDQVGEKGVAQEGLLYPQLQDRIADIVEIRIQGGSASQHEMINLMRQDEAWVIKQRFNYAADHEQLTAMVQALALARLTEKKTKLAKHYARLGVVDPETTPNSESVRLTLVDKQGNTVVDLICGKQADNKSGSFVRKVSDKQSWLIDQTIQPNKKLNDWLDKTIVDLPADSVKRVTYGVMGKEVVLEKAAPEAKHFSLLGLTESQEIAYPGVTDIAVGALNRFQLLDVRKKENEDLSTLDFHTRFETNDGLQIDIKAFKDAEKHFLVLSAESLNDAMNEQAKRYNSLWSPWIFEVDAYSYGQLNKRPEDFLKNSDPAQ